MVWDSKSSHMKEPNLDKEKQAMGFRINTVVVINLSEGVCKQILGHVMDLNYFPWIFNLCLTNHRHFAHYSLPIQLQSSCFYHCTHIFRHLCWCKGGILNNYGITQDAMKDFWVLGKELVMWGCWDILAPSHFRCNNHKQCIQPIICHPNPKYMWL